MDRGMAWTPKLLRCKGKASTGQIKGQDQTFSLSYRTSLGRYQSLHMSSKWHSRPFWQIGNQGNKSELIISKVIYDSSSCLSLSTGSFVSPRDNEIDTNLLIYLL